MIATIVWQSHVERRCAPLFDKKGKEMQKLYIPLLLMVAIGGFIAAGCEAPADRRKREALQELRPQIEESYVFYKTPHKLRKMFVKEREITTKQPATGKLSGGFFFLIGGVGGTYQGETTTTYQVTHVRFAWEIDDNVYIITTLPLEQIRIKLEQTVEVPTVSFFLDAYKRPCQNSYVYCLRVRLGILRDHYSPEEAFSYFLQYAVFTVAEKDWPRDINLPSGGFDR